MATSVLNFVREKNILKKLISYQLTMIVLIDTRPSKTRLY